MQSKVILLYTFVVLVLGLVLELVLVLVLVLGLILELVLVLVLLITRTSTRTCTSTGASTRFLRMFIRKNLTLQLTGRSRRWAKILDQHTKPTCIPWAGMLGVDDKTGPANPFVSIVRALRSFVHQTIVVIYSKAFDTLMYI